MRGSSPRMTSQRKTRERHNRSPPCHPPPIIAILPSRSGIRDAMDLLATVSLSILLGAMLVLAGILSSLVALRFGAPLLLIFLVIGMLAGEAGPGGIRFDDVRTTYLVGSVPRALILFDGWRRPRDPALRSVCAPH